MSLHPLCSRSKIYKEGTDTDNDADADADIDSETPIKILDCRVNPAWNSLPSYSTSHPGSNTNQASVCAIHNNPRHQVALAPSSSSHAPSTNGVGGPSASASTSTSTRAPTDSRVSGLPPLDPSHPRNQRSTANGGGGDGEDTLLERNIVFDRLMSGQETETGEVPPSYGEAVAQAVSRASAGASHGHSRGQSASASRSRGTSRSQSRVRGEVVEVGSSGLGSRAASRVG